MACVAIVADTASQGDILEQALVEHGYVVVLKVHPKQLDDQLLSTCQTDLWIVDLAQGGDAPAIDRLFQDALVPLLYGEGNAPQRDAPNYPFWERRLLGKIKRLLGDADTSVSPDLLAIAAGISAPELPLPARLAESGQQVPSLWLLLGSRGAPVAVKAFLDSLPAGLPLAFVYAQHAQVGQEAELVAALGQHPGWQVQVAEDGYPVHCGELVVIPTDRQVSFDKDGCLRVSDQPWPGPYRPSFDQLIFNMAQRFGADLGIIVFSGVGHDGGGAMPYVLRKGAQLWTQRADSCLSPVLPAYFRDAGYSSFSGEPKELASALLECLLQRLG